MLTVYNTLTKKKEEFKPINPPYVHFYSCGPTVYDYFHIGNARSFISADLIRKYLEYKGYKVKFAMNLTDIDDKIIKRANEAGKQFSDISTEFTQAFFSDIEKLQVKPADIYPKATDHISQIISMIKSLVDKGMAYNSDGNVFYDISKFGTYGKLSGKEAKDLEAGARIDINEEKKNPLDFALWKKAKEGEPWWESPWGNGRPGWHIECSAMSCNHLGETFDIHAGGSDLIFPHHENEIAQSEGATGKQFVNYWLHFGFLNIDNEKMSKSLGNFKTAREILTHYSAQVLRLFYFTTHYSKPLNFTSEGLDGAKSGLEKIENLYSKLCEEVKKSHAGEVNNYDFNKVYDTFESEMDDDFNAPRGIAVIFDFVRDINKLIATESQLSDKFYTDALEFLEKTAKGIFGIVGGKSEISTESSIENDLIELLLEIRTEVKKEKNYRLSDVIRDRLKELGVSLQDSKEGTTFKRN